MAENRSVFPEDEFESGYGLRRTPKVLPSEDVRGPQQTTMQSARGIIPPEEPAPEISSPDPEELSGKDSGDLSRGFSAGIHGFAQSAGMDAALLGETLSDSPLKQGISAWGMETYKRNKKIIEEQYAPTPGAGSLKEVFSEENNTLESLGKLADWAQYNVGQAAGSSLPFIATAVANAPAATLLGVAQGIGEVGGQIFEDTGKLEPGLATAYGVPAGLLDSASGLNFLGKAGKQSLRKTLLESGLTEGVTEAAQDILGRTGSEHAQGFQEGAAERIFDPELMLESAAAGAIGGAALGGGAHVAQKGVNRLLPIDTSVDTEARQWAKENLPEIDLFGEQQDATTLRADSRQLRQEQQEGQRDLQQLPEQSSRYRELFAEEGRIAADGQREKETSFATGLESVNPKSYSSSQEDQSTRHPVPDLRDENNPILAAKETANRLEQEPTIKMYRAMTMIDGKLYPAMSGKVSGVLRSSEPIGKWMRSDERPDLTNEKGEFLLEKPFGGEGPVLYAPYFHSARSPLNDQFSSAWRTNNVIVEVEVPESELTSGYQADKSKKATGEHDWTGTPISKKLGTRRKVVLSRWLKNVRVVPDDEVADIIASQVGPAGIAIPDNLLPKGLRESLERKGVKIDVSGKVDYEKQSKLGFKRDEIPSEDVFLGTTEPGVRESVSPSGAEGDVLQEPDERVGNTSFRMDVNKKNILKITGKQLYGNLGITGSVTLKELFQNSFDAVRGQLRHKKIEQGKIDITTDPTDRTITITDNGGGMDEATLRKALFTLGGSMKDKDVESSGGYGVAKGIFLVGNDKIRINTVKDGVRHVIEATGDDIFGSLLETEDTGVIPPISSEVYKTNAPNGTTITVQIPQTFFDNNTGKQQLVDFPAFQNVSKNEMYNADVLAKSPLFEDKIDVTINGKASRIGSGFPKEQFSPIAVVNHPAFGQVRIFAEKKNNPNVHRKNGHVLINGLWQFDVSLTKDKSFGADVIPRNFYLDIRTTRDPKDVEYPIGLNRQDFAPAHQKVLNKIIDYISSLYAGTANLEHLKSFGEIHFIDKQGKISEKELVIPKLTKEQIEGSILPEDNVDVFDIKGNDVYLNGKKLPEISHAALEAKSFDMEKFQIPQERFDPSIAIVHDNVKIVDIFLPIKNWVAEALVETGKRRIKVSSEIKNIEKILRSTTQPSQDLYALLTKREKEYRDIDPKQEILLSIKSILLNGNTLEDILVELERDIASKTRGLNRLREKAETANIFAEELYEAQLSVLNEALSRAKNIDPNQFTEVSLVDAGVQQFGNRFGAFLNGISRVFMDVRDGIAKTASKFDLDQFSDVKTIPVGISFSKSESYVGIYSYRPFHLMAINPMWMYFPKKPSLAATRMITTMLHEITHFEHSDHDPEYFIADLQTLFAVAQESNIFKHQQQLAKVLEEGEDIIAWLGDLLHDNSAKNIGLDLVQRGERANFGTSTSRRSNIGRAGENGQVSGVGEPTSERDGEKGTGPGFLPADAQESERGGERGKKQVSRSTNVSGKDENALEDLESIPRQVEEVRERDISSVEQELAFFFGKENWAKIKNSGVVEIVDDRRAEQIGMRKETDGLFTKGKIFVRANAEESVLATVLHEAQHAGMEALLGNSYKAFQRQFLRELKAKNPLAVIAEERAQFGVSRWKKKYPNVAESEWQKVLDDERLSYFISEATSTDLQNPRGLLRRIVDVVKAWFRQSALGKLLAEKGIAFELTDGVAIELAKRAALSAASKTKETDNRESVAGTSAKTLLPSTFDLARTLEEQNLEKKSLFQKTGMWKMKDGKWRFELSDRNASLNVSRLTIKDVLTRNARLRDILDHKQLYEAYPDLADVSVIVGASPNWSYYQPDIDTIALATDLVDPDKSPESRFINMWEMRLLKTLLHEIQHAIQEREDFARGTNVESKIAKEWSEQETNTRIIPFNSAKRNLEARLQKQLEPILRKRNDFLRAHGFSKKMMEAFWERNPETKLVYSIWLAEYKADIDTLAMRYGLEKSSSSQKYLVSPYEFYKRALGEVEANTVADRSHFTSFGLKTFPFYDAANKLVKEEDQIVILPGKDKKTWEIVPSSGLESVAPSEIGELTRKIRSQNKTLWDKSNAVIQRWTRPGGLFRMAAPGAHEEQSRFYAAQHRLDTEVERRNHTLRQAILSETGVRHWTDVPEEFLQKVDRALRGGSVYGFGENVASVIVSMRRFIDSLSGQYIGILNRQLRELAEGQETPSEEMLAKAALLQTFLKNQGTYLHRSYRVFQQKGKGLLKPWYKNVPEETLQKAIRFVSETRDMTLEQAASAVNNLLTDMGKSAAFSLEEWIKTTPLGKRDLSILLHRNEEIPQEILDIMGVHTDPLVNFAATAQKQIRLVTNTVFLERLRDIGIQNGWLFDPKTTKDIPIEMGQTIRGGKGYEPLAGLRTSPEVVQALEDATDLMHWPEWLEAIVKVSSAVKLSKTVYSPAPTAIRNYLSSMVALFANADFNWKGLGDAWGAAREYIFDKDLVRKRQRLSHLAMLGVSLDTPFAGEMKDLQHDIQQDDALLFDREAESKMGAHVPRLIWKMTEPFRRGMTRFYQFGDDVVKITAFKSLEQSLEKFIGDRVREQYKDVFKTSNTVSNERIGTVNLKATAKGWSFFDAYGQHITEESSAWPSREGAVSAAQDVLTKFHIEQEAAERIRNTYMTYSMVGRLPRFLRKFPFTGTFVSFPSEVIRTVANMFYYTVKDFKDPDLRPMAIRRFIGMTFVASLPHVLLPILQGFFGADDDEMEAVQQAEARWNKLAVLLPVGRNAKGQLETFNFGFLDLYSWWRLPVKAFQGKDPLGDNLELLAESLVEPFFGMDITVESVKELLQNRKSSEGHTQVYDPAGTPQEQAIAVAYHLWKTVAPTTLLQVEKIARAAWDQNTPTGEKLEVLKEAAALAGWKTTTVSAKTSLWYGNFEASQRESAAVASLSKKIGATNSITEENLRNTYEQAKEERTKAFELLIRKIDASRKLGTPERELRRELRLLHVGAEDIAALVRGKVPRWRPDARLFMFPVDKSKALAYDKETQERITNRRRLVLRWMREDLQQRNNPQ